MKIAVMGGMFDPPHNGHVAIIKAVLEQIQPDEFIVVVCGVPPHRVSSSTAFDDRITMAEEAFSRLDRRIEISDIERSPGDDGVNRTFETLKKICGRYQINDRREICLVIGEDQYSQFTNWYRWQEITEMATLVVAPRTITATQTESLDDLRNAEVIILEMNLINCSSTEVRSLIEQLDFSSAEAMLPKGIIDFYKKKAVN